MPVRTKVEVKTHFDVLDVATRHRVQRWKDLLNDLYYTIDCSIPDGFVVGRLEGFGFDGLRVGRIASDPMAAVRTKSHLASDPLDAYLVIFADGHPLTVTQGGRVTRIGATDFTVISASEPSSFHQLETSTHRNMVIPGAMMRQFAMCIDDFLAVPLGGEPLHEMFYNMANAWSLIAHGSDTDARDLIGKSIVQLLGLVIEGADHKSGESVIRSAHHRLIERIIQDRYADPSFGVTSIAQRTKLSPRRIQSVLAAQGTTLALLIRERRIAEAMRLLLVYDRRCSAQEISRTVGYTDLSRFYKDMEIIGNLPASSMDK